MEAVAIAPETCMHCLNGMSPHQEWHPTRAQLLSIGKEMSDRAKARERDALRVIPDQALVGYGASLRRLLAETPDAPDFLRELAEDWLAEAERQWRWRQKAARMGGDAVVRSAGNWRDRVERVKEMADLSLLIAYENAGARPAWGGKWECCCPFHEDRHPSLDIDVLKRIWICRACDVGGDAITYMQMRHGYTFVQAVEELERRFGIQQVQPVRAVRGVSSDD
jgi:hypothetical protein